jgi:hypothetical protein
MTLFDAQGRADMETDGGSLTALGGDIGERSTAPVLCIQRSLPLGAELADPTLFQPQRLQSIHGTVVVAFWNLVFVYRPRPSSPLLFRTLLLHFLFLPFPFQARLI